MSGIVGCIGSGDIPGLLLQGLSRMEFLGYDSAGMAVLHRQKLRIEKLTGTVRLLAQRVERSAYETDVGIAGLRFASQGEPNRSNAHPQIGCRNDIAVVHSGLIENFEDVKKRLLADGHRFRSQTDTEVLAHLMEGRLSGEGFLEVFLEVLGLLEGSFSFLVLDRGKPGEIHGACAESELWVCQGKGITIISSERAPLIAHSAHAVRVAPGSVVRVRDAELEIFGRDGKPVEAVPQEIGMNLARAQRGGHAFFTLKEIEEQPIAIRRAFSHRVGDRGVRLRQFGLTRRDLREVEMVRVIGSGSSFHAALIAKKYVEDLVRLPAAALPSLELLAGDPVVNEKALLIAFSQSGKTADTVQASRLWHRRGGRVMVITNAPGSPLWREGDGALSIHAGPEIGLVSTKTFTTSLVTSYLFAITLGLSKNALKSVPMLELLYGLQRLPAVVDTLIERRPEIEALAPRLDGAVSVFYTGYGIHYASCLEAALKLKQLASIHAEGIPVGEVKHQVLSLVGPDRPVVFLAPNHEGHGQILEAAREIKKAGGVVLAVTGEKDGELGALADASIAVPSVSGLLSPVASAVVLQLFAAAVALRKGYDLDAPKNLRRYFE